MQVSKPVLFFVTPAYLRYKLSSICFAQRYDAIGRLADAGIEAHCVVIGDDYNRELAKEFDFHIVKQCNDHLGRKFNDGYQYAQEQGATHVFPVGSDSFVDPAFIINGGLPQYRILGSRNYAIVRNDGTERSHLWIPAVSYVMPVALWDRMPRGLRERPFRPCNEFIHRGCDTSTLNLMLPVSDIPHLMFNEQHALETVAFHSPETQVSDYEVYTKTWGVARTGKPFAHLRDFYPHALVSQVEQMYETRRANV